MLFNPFKLNIIVTGPGTTKRESRYMSATHYLIKEKYIDQLHPNQSLVHTCALISGPCCIKYYRLRLSLVR